MRPDRLVLLFFCLCGVPLDTARTQIPAFWADPVSNYMDQRGPNAVGASWVERKLVFDVLDAVYAPPASIVLHPVLNPGLGPFISRFHNSRFLKGLSDIQTRSAPANGIRVFRFYGSGWVVQSPQVTFAVDFHEGPFETIPGLTPNLTDVAATDIGMLADELDAYFITHIHADHTSIPLADAMIQRNKPVFVPQEIQNAAFALGLPAAAFLLVPPPGPTITFGSMTFKIFSGSQSVDYIDPAMTIPVPNSPYNVQNYCYVFELNGVTLCHFGDNNDPDIISWSLIEQAAGMNIDIALQYGHIAPILAQIWTPSLRMHSPAFDFYHIGPAFLPHHMQNSPNLNRRVLLWGEHVDFTPPP